MDAAAPDPDVLLRLLASAGLAQADEVPRPVPLAGGVSSGIWRVDLRSGSYCVKQALPRLKVAKLWEVPVDRVFSEIGYLRTTAPIVPGHVPEVMAEDRDAKCFAMRFLDERHRNWKAELLAGKVDPEAAAAVGDILGRIHAATANRADLAAQFATDANFHALRLEPYLVEAARVHPPLAPKLHALLERTASTRRVLVHGDVSPKNILLGPGGPVLLDAECAWYGDPAFDVAFCLNHFLLKAAHLPRAAAALLACFDRFAAAYAAHVAWEPWPQLESRAATLLPGLVLARVDGKSPVEYLGEPQRAVVRNEAMRLLQGAPAALEALRSHWKKVFPT